jgi:acyl dehydratase
MPDATPQFKQQLKQAFDSPEVGQGFTFRRTFTTGDVTLFCGVTGDYNPYHIDQTFIQESWFKQRARGPLALQPVTASKAEAGGGWDVPS